MVQLTVTTAQNRLGIKEDTAMQKSTIHEMRCLMPAVLIVAVAFTACSADHDVDDMTAASGYAMTVKASKEDDAALARATRALRLDDKTLNAYWKETEEVTVVKTSNTSWKYGTLTPAASTTGSTTLTGKLTNKNNIPDMGEALTLYYPDRTVNYANQTGTLADVEARDYSTAEVTVTGVDAEAKTISASAATFSAHQAVVKFTLQDVHGTAINATSLTISTDDTKIVTRRDQPSSYNPTDKWSTIKGTSLTITPVTATSELWVAFSSDNAAINLTLSAIVGGVTFSYTRQNVTFTDGKYYEITVKMTRPEAVGHALAESAVGEVVGTDGLAYAVADRVYLPSWVTAAGMVAYKDDDYGLVVALTNYAERCNWNSLVYWNEQPKALNHTPAVAGYTWVCGTKNQYQSMWGGGNGCTNYADFNSKLTVAGGTTTNVEETGYYWTSTQTDDAGFSNIFLKENGTNNSLANKDENKLNVRPCFLFRIREAATGHGLASSAIGEIVATDGKAYAAADRYFLPSGVTAVGMVAYKDADYGLVISLADYAPKTTWNDLVYADNHSKPVDSDFPVAGYTWFCGTKDLYQRMWGGGNGCANYDDFKNKLTAAGGKGLIRGYYYWTSTPHETDKNYSWSFNYEGFITNTKITSIHVRPCFFFINTPTLTGLKTLVNKGGPGAYCTGWQVNAQGNIAPADVSGTKIGYVVLTSTTDVDTSVSGSRILVMAANDVGEFSWGSKGIYRENVWHQDVRDGYHNTSILKEFGEEAHPAAFEAWWYDASRPNGASQWFLPAIQQLKDIVSAMGNYNYLKTVTGCDGTYWSSTQDGNSGTDSHLNNALGLGWDGVADYAYPKDATHHVRAVFAY